MSGGEAFSFCFVFQNDECTANSPNNSNEEYLDFPPKLSSKSSPIKQKNIEKLDCPHLMRDFDSYPRQGSSADFVSPSKVDAVSTHIHNFLYIVSSLAKVSLCPKYVHCKSTSGVTFAC